MAFNFPSSPTEGQEYTPAGGPTYTFTGGKWIIIAEDVDWTSIAGKPSTFPPATHSHPQSDIDSLEASLADKADADTLTAHTGNTANPHSVTKAQVGLGNVDNTSDANKPVSTAQAAADTAATNAAIAAMPTPTTPTDVLTGTDTINFVTPDALAALWEKGGNVASATPLILGEGGFFHVTGTNAISDIDFGTAKNGRSAWLIFDSTLSLINSASLLIPGGSLVTAPGDRAFFVQDSGDNVICTVYIPASTGILAPASTTDVLTGTSASKAVTPDALAALFEAYFSVPAANPLVLPEGGYFYISGSGATITNIRFATASKDGRTAWLHFEDANTLQNGNLIVPGGSITTVAGDFALYVQNSQVDAGSGRIIDYQRFDGKALAPDLVLGGTTHVLIGTSTVNSVTPDALAALWEKGANVASAATLSLGEGGFFHVTGTTGITDIDFATPKDGRRAWLIFDGSLTITHNATTLILPAGGNNIGTAAGDRALFVQDNADNVVCLAYIKADGTALVGAGLSAATTTEVLTGSLTGKAATPDAVAALWEKGTNVASAATISLGEGGFFHITGTTGITDIDFATPKDGRCAWLIFDGVLLLTHNATTLILPGGANITTAAGDRALFVQDATDNVYCLAYIKADGQGVLALKGSTVSGSSTVTLPDGEYFLFQGNNNTVTDFDFTVPKDGRMAWLFADPGSSAATLVHHATTLRLPGEANIKVDPGDRFLVLQETGDNAVVLAYEKYDGRPLVSATGFRNLLLNPYGAVNQRAAVSNADDTYGHDRWYALTETGTIAVSTTEIFGSPGNQYQMMRLTQSQASAQRMGYAQIIEGKNCKHLRGKKVGISGLVRMSAAVGLRWALLEWNGAEDAVTSDVVNNWASTTFTNGNFFIADANLVPIGSGVMTISPTANTLTEINPGYAVTLGSSFNNLILFVWSAATMSQNATLDLAVQIEEGSPTPREFRPYPVELELCQRYYQSLGETSTFPSVRVLGGAGGNYTWPISFAREMRATPTAVKLGVWTVQNCPQPTLTLVGAAGFSFAITATAAGDAYAMPGSSDDEFTFSAEL